MLLNKTFILGLCGSRHWGWSQPCLSCLCQEVPEPCPPCGSSLARPPHSHKPILTPLTLASSLLLLLSQSKDTCQAKYLPGQLQPPLTAQQLWPLTRQLVHTAGGCSLSVRACYVSALLKSPWAGLGADFPAPDPSLERPLPMLQQAWPCSTPPPPQGAFAQFQSSAGLARQKHSQTSPAGHPGSQQQRHLAAQSSPALRPAYHLHPCLQLRRAAQAQLEEAQPLCFSSCSFPFTEDNTSRFYLAFIKRKVIKRGSGAPSSSKLVVVQTIG